MKKNLASKIILVLLLLIIVLVIVYSIWEKGSRKAYDGIREPLQTPVSSSSVTDKKKTVGGWDVTITPLYNYDIEALVVHTHNYTGFSLGDRLAPRDLALAWGDVASLNNDIDFHWNQNSRWYSWKIDNYAELSKVGTVEDVSRQSANTHIIPADFGVKMKLFRVRTGDHIRMTGYLVSVYAEKSSGKYWTWNSSTSREDTGDGACEVFYVESIEWVD